MSSDETPPVSGSRWEPTPGEQSDPVATTPRATAPQSPAYAPAPPPQNRGRLALAGGAVGIALIAGGGGFALGHAAADDGRDGRFGPGFRQGFGQLGPGGGFPNGQQGPGDGMPGFGNQPPSGQDGSDPRGDDGQDGQPQSGSSTAPDTGGSHT